MKQESPGFSRGEGVNLDHVYWDWPSDSPAHIGLNGIKTIHLINQQQGKETE